MYKQPIEFPVPTVDEPSFDEIEDMAIDGAGCWATDGCWVEPDGCCPHGHVSWLIYFGVI